jgi:hypothetical protein
MCHKFALWKFEFAWATWWPGQAQDIHGVLRYIHQEIPRVHGTRNDGPPKRPKAVLHAWLQMNEVIVPFMDSGFLSCITLTSLNQWISAALFHWKYVYRAIASCRCPHIIRRSSRRVAGATTCSTCVLVCSFILLPLDFMLQWTPLRTGGHRGTCTGWSRANCKERRKLVPDISG